MTKTLLIISGGEKSVEIVQALRAMGHAVVVSDSDPQAPAFAFADSCLIADVHGASETAAAAERYSRKIRKIDGVLSVADACLTAAMVTERLKLPGPPPHVTELLGDRMAIRRCFASAGIASIDEQRFAGGADEEGGLAPFGIDVVDVQRCPRSFLGRDPGQAGDREQSGEQYQRGAFLHGRLAVPTPR